MYQNNNMEKIRTIQHQNDEFSFHMAIQCLFKTGHQNITEKTVVDEKKSIRQKPSKNPLMSVEFQCAILDIVFELSKIPIWDILLYIKLYVPIKGDDLLKQEEARQAVTAWDSLSVPKSWKDAIADPDILEEILQLMMSTHKREYSDAEIMEAFSEIVGNPE